MLIMVCMRTFGWIVLGMLCVNGVAIAQASSTQDNIIAWQKTLGDDWFNEQIDAALKIGDQVPDFDLRPAINLPPGVTHLSDLKGKLVILDFWSLNCSMCVASFPHMVELQKKFGDKIQIILVNAWESQRQIDNKLSTWGKSSFLPTLPILTGSREDLLKLFPVRVVPHHVWIDPAMHLRVTGAFNNTQSSKIIDQLAGKQVTSLSSSNNVPRFNSKLPYYSIIDELPSLGIYASFFTSYNMHYTGPNGGWVRQVIDTPSTTIRNTYINTEGAFLYKEAFLAYTGAGTKGPYLWSPTDRLGASSKFDELLFLVNDTFRYTSEFKDWKLITDEEVIQSRWCYEQLCPSDMPKKEQGERMLVDLNQHFGNLYGVLGSFEKRRVSCYIVVRTTKDKLLSFRSKKKGIYGPVTKGIQSFFSYWNYPFQLALRTLFSGAASHGFSSFVFNETGYDGLAEMDLPLPEAIHSIEDIRRAIQPYGLDIQPAERDLDFLVLREQVFK